jgi:hypothetical protein
MSVATEIQRIQGAKANIKAAIEQKGVTVGDGTIDTYAEKISEISGGGGIDWLYYASNCNNIFGGVTFPENSQITIRLKSCTNFGYMFTNTTNIKSIKMISDTVDSIVDMSRFCYTSYNNLKTLEMVDFTEFHKKFKDIFNIFYNQFNLKTVLGAMDLTNCTVVTNAFSSCSALEDIEFEKGTIKISISFANCSLLTNASIQSIIDGLADLTGGTAQTLTVHSTVYQKIVDNGWDVEITAKNWTLVKA